VCNAQGNAKGGEEVGPVKWMLPDYNEAVASGQLPHVSFVGVAPRPINGVLVSHAKSIWHEERWQSKGVIVVRSDGYVWLPHDADDAMIRRNLKAVSQPALPFDPSTSADSTTAKRDDLQALPVGDVDPWLPESEQKRIRAMWPKSIPIPHGLAFYRPTRWVQQSAVTDYPQKGLVDVLTIGSIPRPRREPYNVPGGLAHIPRSEWRAFPAATRGMWVEHFSETVPFSGAYGGKLRRINRQFSGGAFFDLLVNRDGKAFELRAIEYDDDGNAEAMVVFKDASARPAGYERVKTSACLACHADAGAVRYSSGNAPGGGGNFSLPFKD
jgi:hypothetical protein